MSPFVVGAPMTAMVPEVVIVPPDKAVPAVMDVKVPVVGVFHLSPVVCVLSAVST